MQGWSRNRNVIGPPGRSRRFCQMRCQTSAETPYQAMPRPTKAIIRTTTTSASRTFVFVGASVIRRDANRATMRRPCASAPSSGAPLLCWRPPAVKAKSAKAGHARHGLPFVLYAPAASTSSSAQRAKPAAIWTRAGPGWHRPPQFQSSVKKERALYDHRRRPRRRRARTFPTISRPSGCRSRRTAPSRSARGSSRARRTCITITPEGREILDATAGSVVLQRRPQPRARSWPRSSARRPSSTSPRPSSSPIRRRSSSSSRIAALAPGDLDHVFFTNSGSEAADTALKIALAYHNVRGQGSRQRLIGRERGYHGVGFGGISVGGMVNNRKFFGSLLAGVDHLPATYNREHQAFTKGEPEWGGHLADALERHRRPARRLDHRRRHRRADGGLDRRPAGAQGLPPAAARDLRQIRHPAHFRRSHHRLRPPRAAPSRPSATASSPT